MGCFHSKEAHHVPSQSDPQRSQATAPHLLSLAQQCISDPVQLMMLSQVMSQMPAAPNCSRGPWQAASSAGDPGSDHRTSPSLRTSQALQAALAANWSNNFNANRCLSADILFAMACSQDATPVDSNHVCLRGERSFEGFHHLVDNALGRSRSAIVDSHQQQVYLTHGQGTLYDATMLDNSGSRCQGPPGSKQRRATAQSAADWSNSRTALTTIKEGANGPRHVAFQRNVLVLPSSPERLSPDPRNLSLEAGLAMSTPFEMDSMSTGPSPRISHPAMSASTPDVSSNIKGVLLSKPLLSDPTQRSFVPASNRKVHKMHSGSLQTSVESSPRRAKGSNGLPSPAAGGVLDRQSSSMLSHAPSYPDSRLSLLSSPRDSPATPNSNTGGVMSRQGSHGKPPPPPPPPQQQQQQQQQQQRVHFAPLPGQPRPWIGIPPGSTTHVQLRSTQGLSAQLAGISQGQWNPGLQSQPGSDGSVHSIKPGAHMSQPMRSPTMMMPHSRPNSFLDAHDRSASAITQPYMLMAQRSKPESSALSATEEFMMRSSSSYALHSGGSITEPRSAHNASLEQLSNVCKTPPSQGSQLSVQALLQSKLREQQRQHGVPVQTHAPVARSSGSVTHDRRT